MLTNTVKDLFPCSGQLRWRNNTDCCSWDGINCDPKTGSVVELNLLGSSLNGSLRSNSSLFRLQHLQILDLSSNNLAGALPDSIGNLKNLRVLKLLDCNLFGKLPSSSKLSGNFPHVLLNLSEHTTINLHFNQLEGRLPSNMSSFSKLEYFNIGSNSFSGSIPSSLFMIPSLIHLSLERDGFNGPLEIGNSSSPSKLQTLSLGGNNLNGPFPRFISKLAGLSYLDLSFWNIRRGVVDFRIFLHLKSLTFLDLSHLNTRIQLSIFPHCLNGIQSTKMEEVRNGMAKDVLNPRSSRSVCSMVQKSLSCCFSFPFYRTPAPNALISYLFGPWCERPSIRAWTRLSPSRALLVDLLDRLKVL
ncbi:hypothetical protein DY000_02039317 [Brassica cretica]|uniref:Leucine-rich repeat-containing N-terminal plant-type domain-containing protein n=1 Tax=Brassica cretica TaxID=69181 RepID=A0ABQ7BB14_BRACR|nr:hypothetical protein DY000_02039317 [Brassica cretica]